MRWSPNRPSRYFATSAGKEPQHVATAALASVQWSSDWTVALASGPHYDGPLNRALRNHDIADRHFLSEARTTKTPWVADAGCATEQIIPRQNSYKADKASGSAGTSSP
jgi:hypothetical protein